MNVAQAREAAEAWVAGKGAELPGFQGAFIHGSMNDLPGDAPVAPTSDVDVMVVLDDPDLPQKPGKFRYRDVLLEVSYLASEQVESPERVLGEYNLAGSFRSPSILADPTGQLAIVQAAVAAHFAERRWVKQRCDQAADKVRTGFPLKPDDPIYTQMIGCVFPAGVLTHVLLVAGMKNPTVRRRYATTRALLAEYGELAIYPRLLELLGCAGMEREQVERHLSAMTNCFDTAKTLDVRQYAYASDISDLARPISVDGSRELIERGLHREAVFWIAVTYGRCLTMLDRSGTPQMYATFDPGFRALLTDLGIGTFPAMQQRRAEINAAVPAVREVAARIMAAHPDIIPGL